MEVVAKSIILYRCPAKFQSIPINNGADLTNAGVQALLTLKSNKCDKSKFVTNRIAFDSYVSKSWDGDFSMFNGQ